MEEIISEELTPQFKTMFAKLPTLEAYNALNDAIGTAKSYPDEKSDTMCYGDPNPTPVNGLYFIEITAEVQERWPELLAGFELIERKPDVYNQDKEVPAEGI
jgi:hypothetical protein